MMMNWIFKGLRTGIKTTSYPERNETAAGVSPGLPLGTRLSDLAKAEGLAKRCPTRAIASLEEGMRVDRGSCVHCLRCHREPGEGVMRWDTGYEWAASGSQDAVAAKLEKAFGRSLHIRFVDAGACGACVSEARQLNNPYYNMHRLGFFVTPTPRNADVLMVSGPVSNAMMLPLLKAYEAMPEPKRVLAIGACAISGGVFGPSFAASGGVADIIPVDVTVPGCPPPPLAILHGLLVLAGRKPAGQTVSIASSSEREAV
jgi:Ni,Fe-hydrogenase III small subunit